MVRRSAGAIKTIPLIFAILVATMLSVPTRAIAEDVAPEGPKLTMTDTEHEDFMQFWLDVFARGARSLNETPDSYNFDGALKKSLTFDLIARLKEESPEIARQFDPAVAGPMFGFSSPDAPLIGPDGSEITAERIDEVYASFIGGIIFEREAFIAKMEKLLEPMTPDESALGSPPDTGPEDMRNEIREALAEQPILEWANDLVAPTIPDGFATDVPVQIDTPVRPVEMDLSTHVSTSPFNAAPGSAWLDPDFHLALPNLLAFLSTLSGLETDQLLRELGLLASEVHQVVPRIEGTLDMFPQLAGPIAAMRPLAATVTGALVPVEAPLALRISTAPPGAELPPELAEAMANADDVATGTQYVVVLNGVAYEGTWEAPQAVDVDGDNVPDAILDLTLATPTVGVGDKDAERVPLFTLERLDPAATAASVMPTAAHLEAELTQDVRTTGLPGPGVAVPDVELPASALSSIDLVVAYRVPATGELVGYVGSIAGGVDHLEVLLRSMSPSVEIVTTGGHGAFDFAAIVGPAEDRHIAVVTADAPPSSATITAALDAESGVADLTGDVVATGHVAIAGIHTTPGARLAVGAASDALAPLTLTTRGDDFDLTTRAGSAVTVERQEGVAGSATTFTTRTLAITDAAERTEALLGDDALSFEAAKAGSSITMLVGSVIAGVFVGGAWAEVTVAGKRATLDLKNGGVSFTSDRNVGLVRAVRADSEAAALSGGITPGVLYATEDLIAYSLASARSASATPTATGFDIEMVSASTAGFFMFLDRVDDMQQYYLTNLPHRASFAVSPTGLTVGASENVDNIYGYLERSLDGATVPPTTTILFLEDVTGTAAVSMSDASVNTFLTGSVSELSVLSSNVVGHGGTIFESLPGQHTLAEVNGASHQYSASLVGASGSIVGSLFGPLATITIEMSIEGPLCQTFGNGGTTMELCISNVPSRIDLALAALPTPKIIYDASDVIHEISLALTAPSIDISFAIQEIPQHIELNLSAGALTLSMDDRLGGLVFTGEIGTTTIGAGILDLPQTLSLTWGTGGITPSIPAGDAIGRVYMFVSTPGVSFNVDIVHLPPSVISWNAGAITFGPSGDRIGSAIVQLAVSDLQLVLQADGIPGATVSWNTAGGTLSTNGALDDASVSVTKGPWYAPTVSLYLGIVGVPQLVSNWNTNSMSFSLGSAKIDSLTFQFQASDLLLYAGATGIPTSTFSMSGNGFTVNAPNAINSIILVLAKGAGYFDPFNRAVDFAGVYLRPDQARFGVSAKLTGLKSLSYSRNTAARSQTVTVGFTTDKSFQVLADLQSAALTAYADLYLTNLPATTSFTISAEGVALSGTPVNGGRSTPWLQAYVGVGTPGAYTQTPEPRWPWQTAGDWRGIMGNTMVDTTAATPSLATKWKVYAPLPNVISLTKVTANGMPASYTLNAGVSLGKLDIRTGVKTNINPCTGCAPMLLNTMAVVTVSNLPTSLSVSEGLGSGSGAGSPSFTIGTAQSVNKLFLGIRFDNSWYSNGDESGGFPIYGSLSQIPTSMSLTISKSGGWNGGKTPAFGYSANANTLDAALYLNIGQLWTMFGKSTITAAAAAGRPVPGWLLGLAQMDASGHLLMEITDLPAAGVAMYRSGQNLVVDPLGSVPLTKFFVDFDLRFEKSISNSGCLLCGVVSLDWWYNFGYWWQINELSLLLENLRYVALDPAIESVITLDGHMVFHFRASAGISFGAGVALRVNVVGLTFTLVCVCVPTVNLGAMIDPGFITFQVQSFTWSINYFTFGWPCHWAEPWYEVWWHAWCETHYTVGVNYTVPTNWQWDAPIALPPYVPFRGLNLYSGTHHVFLDPRILSCAGSFCWEVGRLIPPSLVMAYAYVKYTSISGPNWGSYYHEHW